MSMFHEKLEDCPKCNAPLHQSEYDMQFCTSCGWDDSGLARPKVLTAKDIATIGAKATKPAIGRKMRWA